jgi:hypothetical protein
MRARLLSICLMCAAPAFGADVTCGVGQKIEGGMGGGQVGEILEVGSEPPHLGWYRIAFTWAPQGEWYDPRSWKVHPQGSRERCVAPASAEPATVAAPDTAPSEPESKPSTPSDPSTDACPAGTEVVDRERRRGTVQGERDGMCVVRLVDGSEHSYLRWMLSAADAAPASAPLPAGTYVCSTNGAGIFRIALNGKGGYIDRAGTRGDYAIASDGRLGFEGGSLDGYPSKVLGAGKFGLASEATTRFHTVCNLKR